MQWINSKKIDTFNLCPSRYEKMYLIPGNKKEWNPDPDLDRLRDNIRSAFRENAKLLKGRVPPVETGINATDEDMKALKGFNDKLKELTKRVTNYKQLEKPLFYNYSDAFGLFSSPDIFVDLDVPTAVFIKFNRSSRFSPDLEPDIEHILNTYVLNEKSPNIKRVLYLFPYACEHVCLDIRTDDLRQGRISVEKFIKDLSISKFEAKRNAFCDWCDFQAECNAWKDQVFIFEKTQRQKMFRLSYSKLDVFKKCPYLYKKIYIEKIPQLPKDYFSVGTTIHSVMEFIEKLNSPVDIREIHNIYLDKWESAGFKDSNDEKEQKVSVWEWFSEYLKSIALNPFKKAFLVEQYFQFPIRDKVIVNGFIDRIDEFDGKYRIIDYKTEKNVRTQEEVDSDLQLTLYYWALDKFGLELDCLELHFVRFSEIVRTFKKKEDLVPFEEEMLFWADKILSEKEFNPVENKNCDFCDLRHTVCPLFNP